jgi:hypothetical protein
MEWKLKNAVLEVVPSSLYHQIQDVTAAFHEKDEKGQDHAKGKG